MLGVGGYLMLSAEHGNCSIAKPKVKEGSIAASIDVDRATRSRPGDIFGASIRDAQQVGAELRGQRRSSAGNVPLRIDRSPDCPALLGGVAGPGSIDARLQEVDARETGGGEEVHGLPLGDDTGR